jgi:hypothetical protein
MAPMQGQAFRSLRTRLLVLAISATVLGVGLLSWVAIDRTSELQQQSVEAEADAETRAVAAAFSGLLDSKLGVARELARVTEAVADLPQQQRLAILDQIVR